MASASPVSTNESSDDDASADESPQRLKPRGSNQSRVRQFNERVVLQAIRLHGSIPKAEIARLTHLTPQTIQIIIARLEADGLVNRLAPLRGKVGQPSVPMALNRDGAFSIGIKIGRRQMDMLLVDFAGEIRERLSLSYGFPDADTLFRDIDARMKQLRRSLAPRLRARVYGVGVAAPLSLDGWQQLLGVAPKLAQKWHGIDIQEGISRLPAALDLPVTFVKDTNAACVAELVAGRGRSIGSFLYIYVDTFIGGGLVLDSHLHGGGSGNAGALGSLPVGLARRGQPVPEQLLSTASLHNLETLYAHAGLDIDAWRDERALEGPWKVHTRAWLRKAAPAVAMAINSAACFLDLHGVIIDGAFGRGLLALMLDELTPALDHYSWEGVARPGVWAGTVGPEAQALGGALLPLYANFAPDRSLFLKVDAAE